jgi:hypothetical protein
MAQKKSFKADLTNPAMQFISTPADGLHRLLFTGT